jgi:hypothetical protein
MLSSRTQENRRNKTVALAVGLSLVAILLVGAAPGMAATPVTTYNNVQIYVHTTNSTFTGTYTFTAYNATGYALVSYQTPYPAGSFELPSASYIFTVSANSQGLYACPLLTGVASAGAGASSSSSGSGAGTTIILPPCRYGAPQSEYGFSVQQVSGPTSITISTMPIGSYPTETVTIHVHYVNGTAAPGTNLFASVLGGYWYGLTPTPLSMTGVTGKDGTASLVVPVAPIMVTAWKWTPIAIPITQSSTIVKVGGENVNVSASWEPSYIGLAGSVLVVPPQVSGAITLHSQQPTYWATPDGALTTSGSTTGGTAVGAASETSGPDLVPASITSQSATASGVQTVVSTSTVVEQVSSPAGTTSTLGASSANYDLVLLTIVGAVALGIASASLIIVRKEPKDTPVA